MSLYDHCFNRHAHIIIALQPFDDSIGLDDYEDSFLLPEDSTLADTILLDDLDFEPADETIERDVSLLPFQHYSPPSKLFDC